MPARPAILGFTSSTMTDSTTSPPILTEEAKIGIGMSIPIIVITVVILVVYRCIRGRKRNRSAQATKEEEGGSSEEIQPYLDHKGELETEGLGKYELDGEEKIAVLSEESEICEMPTGNSDIMSTSSRLELKGCDQPRSELKGEESLTPDLIGGKHFTASVCSQHISVSSPRSGIRVDSHSAEGSLCEALVSPKKSQHPYF